MRHRIIRPDLKPKVEKIQNEWYISVRLAGVFISFAVGSVEPKVSGLVDVILEYKEPDNAQP